MENKIKVILSSLLILSFTNSTKAGRISFDYFKGCVQLSLIDQFKNDIFNRCSEGSSKHLSLEKIQEDVLSEIKTKYNGNIPLEKNVIGGITNLIIHCVKQFEAFEARPSNDDKITDMKSMSECLINEIGIDPKSVLQICDNLKYYQISLTKYVNSCIARYEGDTQKEYQGHPEKLNPDIYYIDQFIEQTEEKASAKHKKMIHEKTKLELVSLAPQDTSSDDEDEDLGILYIDKFVKEAKTPAEEAPIDISHLDKNKGASKQSEK